MRIRDWSSDVCSSDLPGPRWPCDGKGECAATTGVRRQGTGGGDETPGYGLCDRSGGCLCRAARRGVFARAHPGIRSMVSRAERESRKRIAGSGKDRSEEHTSELQSLMRISYAVFCLKNKKKGS